MKRLPTISLMALLAVLTIVPANAQNYSQYGQHSQYAKHNQYGWRNPSNTNINVTQAQLQQRVNRGITSGRISQREATKLQEKLSRFATAEARMRTSGGRLTARERTRLNSQLAILNAEITRDLNDFERRRVSYWNNRPWR